MKLPLHLLLSALLVLLFACNSGSVPAEMSAAYSDQQTNTKESSGATSVSTGADNTVIVKKVESNKIIRNASIQIQVKDIEESHKKIAAQTQALQAYFQADNRTTSSGRIENTMIIRVPATSLDKFLQAIMKESIYTDYQNISAEDVSDQFIDVEARLKTKREIEQRYLTLLKSAKNVSEVLEVEEKLGGVREEIESAEGRLKLLNNQVAYSTVNLTTYQQLDYVPQPETSFWWKIKRAVANGWSGLTGFVLLLFSIWPFLILAVGCVWAFRHFRARKKRV